MVPPYADDVTARQLCLFAALQDLLALEAGELGSTLNEACGLIARALAADGVDVLLYEAPTNSLVSVRAADTAAYARQRAHGLDRLPLAAGSPSVGVFRTGASRHMPDLAAEPDERYPMAARAGVRGAMLCRVGPDGAPHGVLRAVSEHPDRFAPTDMAFLETAGRWMGLVMDRAELLERRQREAVEPDPGEGDADRRRLTRRQQEVARLVAAGLSNEEIAARLVLVRGTVSNHVEAILGRLGFHRRTQIAAWATARGLHRPNADDG
jgi:DNA-binding NarL/FixJ family response regulator